MTAPGTLVMTTPDPLSTFRTTATVPPGPAPCGAHRPAGRCWEGTAEP